MDARSLSIVVPSYNEERRLPALLDAFQDGAAGALTDAGFRLHELIVVDDGSTDGSAQLLEDRASTISQLRVIRFPSNRGKGAAVRAGMLAASAEYALLTDVDMATPLSEIGTLAAGLAGGFDIAIGSRGLPTSTIEVHQRHHRELMGRIFNRMLRLATGLPFRDTQCGFKLYRVDRARCLFELQTIEGFAFDAEVLVLARVHGVSVAEIPVHWADDHRTTVGIVRAPASMLRDLLRIGWAARRRRNA